MKTLNTQDLVNALFVNNTAREVIDETCKVRSTYFTLNDELVKNQHVIITEIHANGVVPMERVVDIPLNETKVQEQLDSAPVGVELKFFNNTEDGSVVATKTQKGWVVKNNQNKIRRKI